MKRYSRVYASVNLDAAIENMEAMHRLLKKDTSMFAVIKTDGYGHGATELARVLEPASVSPWLLCGHSGRRRNLKKSWN